MRSLSHVCSYYRRTLALGLKKRQKPASIPASQTKINVCYTVCFVGGSGDPTFRCGGCGKHFKEMTSLKRHARYVCGKAAVFKCPYCPHSTKLRANLKKHINDKHDPNPLVFRCQFCSFAAKQKVSLVRHRILCHTDKFKPD
ncbi:hypothetical protein AAG570_013975 [Ranatra chinensis]|uniref:C2H2-type domain-containing protein n=1 Tax=Ranatra chinensis TaxID=642074 RepID=A0ABD0Z201_9HEMI